MVQGELAREKATNILREVSRDNAFFFYDAVDTPNGLIARSLGEFQEILRSLKPSCIQFHMDRGDFENWVKLLGDEALAKQIASLRSKELPINELHRRLIQVVSLRTGRLRKIAATS